MKRYAVGLILGMSALGAMAQVASSGEPAAVVQAQPAAIEQAGEQAAPVAVAPADASLPEGVVTEQNPVKKAYLALKKDYRPLLFRPNPNMPEMTDEETVRKLAESGSRPILAKGVGYLPKPILVPCAKGCEGKNYDRAVEAFLKGYWANGLFKERGEVRMQVRWFSVRPPFIPVGADTFGISFIAEGKLVSIGRSTGFGSHFTDTKDIASAIGAMLGRTLAYSMGMGLRPIFLKPLDEKSFVANLRGIVKKVDRFHGADDTTPRFEPVTAEYEHLLPAMDGIRPGEIAPATGVTPFAGIQF
jgi:hypothetical protein